MDLVSEQPAGRPSDFVKLILRYVDLNGTAEILNKKDGQGRFSDHLEAGTLSLNAAFRATIII
jgi:hypothetical protein